MKGNIHIMNTSGQSRMIYLQKKPIGARAQRGARRLLQRYQLILMLLPAVIIVILFNYVPMYGVQIAFRDYTIVKGFLGSPWVGLKHFQRFFNSYNSITIIKNTILLSLYTILWSFPIPIFLALMLNQVNKNSFKRTVQTITYLPYFISTVVMVGMIFLFLSQQRGLYGALIKVFGMENAPDLLSDPKWFRTVYIFTGVWQTTGFASVIYLAALSGVDPALYEAAIMDGAGKLQRVFNIDLPCLLPTITIMFIIAMGNLMNVGFEKTFLMQNVVNQPVSEVLATYVYKVGLVNAQYSFSAAVNLFNTGVNIVLLLLTNYASKRMSGNSLL
jgi:putative aldouronate transport system permease protein